jgi:dTDP-4-dehydrorhamnose 3,5-epimerase-like enzyme
LRLATPARSLPYLTMNTLADAKLIDLPRHASADGEVVVAEAVTQVPFRIERMFTLAAPIGAKRGRHAHRLCSQFMICVNGAVDIVCDDGRKQNTFVLDRRDVALLVPPEIWNTVDFRHDGSVLVVLCDRVYEAHDYIRDYAEFRSFRESVQA